MCTTNHFIIWLVGLLIYNLITGDSMKNSKELRPNGVAITKKVGDDG